MDQPWQARSSECPSCYRTPERGFRPPIPKPLVAVQQGLYQISGIYGWSGMAVDFTLRCRGAAYDPECDCREAAASVQGRLRRPALRGVADPAGGLLVSALSPELPRH